ncbi:hypothetical protein K439DRAFT_1625285 [Ramaria rubella]|nr:hypothetical protein K439DRAFT_1625285 [Ramaria rubella]
MLLDGEVHFYVDDPVESAMQVSHASQDNCFKETPGALCVPPKIALGSKAWRCVSPGPKCPLDSARDLGSARAKRLKVVELSSNSPVIKDKKVRMVDPGVEFMEGELLQVSHSRCGKYVWVDEPYNVTKFRKHAKGCEGGTAGGMATISTFFASVKDKGPPKELQMHLCPGITARSELKLGVYLQRTGTSGGGSKSVTLIAHTLYSKCSASLDKKQKAKVKEQQGTATPRALIAQ